MRIIQRYLKSVNHKLPDAEVTLTPSAIPYTGLPQAPTSVLVTVDGYTLTEGKDYTCEIEEKTAMGTYEVTVYAIGSCYQGSITQTWEIIEKDAAAQSAVTVTYKPSTNIATVSGLPRVWATLVVAQYSGDRMVDVRVRPVYGSNTYYPGDSFDATKGDTYTAFLLNTSNVPLSKATKS